LGISFDLILAIAVWMRILPATRPRAFRKLVTLLKPGGLLWILVRDGPDEPGRPTWAAKEGEIEALATNHGLTVVRSVHMPDHEGRAEVSWTAMFMRLPDDGAGALPLLRGIILNDDKSSTYKLALLRSIARIANSASATAVDDPENDAVRIPPRAGGPELGADVLAIDPGGSATSAGKLWTRWTGICEGRISSTRPSWGLCSGSPDRVAVHGGACSVYRQGAYRSSHDNREDACKVHSVSK
jgi:hypothetical protein